jgi:hypothetical protein
VVVAHPCQRLQLAGGGIQRPQRAQPVAVGAQVVGQLVAVTRVRLGSRRAPAGPGGVEGVGVDRDDQVAGGQQPVHDEATGPLDGHRQLLRTAMAGQSGQRLVQAGLGVFGRPPVHDPAGIVDDGHVVCGAGPVPSHEHRRLLISRCSSALRPGLPVSHCSALAAGVSLKPVCGSRGVEGGRTQTGRLAARQRGHPPTPTEEHDPLHADRVRDTRPMSVPERTPHVIRSTRSPCYELLLVAYSFANRIARTPLLSVEGVGCRVGPFE